jgi:hypothetical protein
VPQRRKCLGNKRISATGGHYYVLISCALRCFVAPWYPLQPAKNRAVERWRMRRAAANFGTQNA